VDEYLERLKDNKINELKAVGSKDIVTEKEFWPSLKVVFISLTLVILIYIIFFVIF